jgi:hypothetical protein
MEKAFSIFLFIDNDTISKIGYVCYEENVSDDTLITIIKKNIQTDLDNLKKFIHINPCISYAQYFSSVRLGNNIQYFEKIFEFENAVSNPLYIITSVVNGFIRIDHVTKHEPFIYTEEIQKLNTSNEYSKMPDYLDIYREKEGFNFPKLINDDYFIAIKELYNKKLYVSAMKLILIFIDTIGFIEFGDSKKNVFINWLEIYADLSKHDITAEELWEYRNGLIHMTNLDSKKVSKGNVCRILLFPCGVKNFIKNIDLNEKILDMPLLLKETIPLALSKWFNTYNVDRNKIESFVERYDLIVSDSRLGILNV